MTESAPSPPPPVAAERVRLRAFGAELRAGEGPLAARLCALSFLLLVFQYACKAVRQSMFIDTLGAERLPLVYLLIAAVAVPVVALYGRLADRWPLDRLLAGASLAVAGSLLGFWWLLGRPAAAAAVSVAFYLWIAIVGLLLVSLLWSFAGERLDPRQARRLYALIGAGGILGSVVGGQLAAFAGRAQAPRSGLLWAAAALVLAAVLAVGRRGEQGRGRAPAVAGDLGEVGNGWAVVRASSYLRWIALLVLLATMVAQVVDLQFSWVVERATTGLAERTAAFGTLYTVTGLLAFLFQLLATTRIHRRLGVGFALRLAPLGNALGTGLFVAAALLAPAWLLPAVWALKIGENGLRYSLDQASRELLFLPIPAAQRRPAKAFIDVFVQRLAKGVAALALLAVTFGWIGIAATAWLSLGWIVLWLLAVGAVRRRYLAAYRAGLLHRDTEADAGLDATDPATLEILIEGLGSAESREVLHSLELLRAHGRGRLVPPILLRHDDPAVRGKTLEVLQAAERLDAVAAIEELLADHEPAVRAGAARALGALSPAAVLPTMAARLGDPAARVRPAAAGYLAGCGHPGYAERAAAVLAEMRGDGDPAVRRAAAPALGALAGAAGAAALVGLLYDSDVSVVRAAIEAVSERVACGRREPHFVPILVAHLHDRRLKHDARDALVAYGETVVPALQHFMNDRQEEIWVRRALPKTLARIGGHAALTALAGSLAAPDPFLRRKVIEALIRLRTEADLRPQEAVVEGQLGAECLGYVRTLVDLSCLHRPHALPMRGPLVVWPPGAGAAHLLERLLADRMRDHLRNVFGLLALLHPPRDVRAAYRGLLAADPRLRAHALEYLDNLLAGEPRRLVFAVIDDQPVAERRRQLSRHFVLTERDRTSTVRRLMTHRPADDADAVWLTAAALHYVHDRTLTGLYPQVREVATADRAALVQEAALYLLPRLG